MCTSILMKGKRPLFGRNMDLYYELDCSVVITPRNYPFSFRAAGILEHHYAMTGMAVVKEGYPLYCEAVNEHGLAVAGLDFPGNAFYSEKKDDKKANISPFELIPWVLSKCKNITEAKTLLEDTHITAINFSESLPLSPLHWHFADRDCSIVFEVTDKGAKTYDDPMNVMTNNPPFDFHLSNISHYLNLTAEDPSNCLAEMGVRPVSFGLGSFGLPGDFSSASRFVKASYLLKNSVCEGDKRSITQFFHLLASVAMVRGSVLTPKGNFDLTAYSCCIDLLSGIYYYTTYENSRINVISMKKEDIDGCGIYIFPLEACQDFKLQN